MPVTRSEVGEKRQSVENLQSPRVLKRVKVPSKEHESVCKVSNRKDTTECTRDLCLELREENVRDIRAVAKILNVPHYACLAKKDLCEAIDRQIVTYFALKEFLEGSKRLRESVKMLKVRSNEVAEEKGKKYALTLLDLSLYLMEKYNEMFELATSGHDMTHEKRNEKLISTASETLGQANTFIRGIGGTFIDQSFLRRQQ